MYPDSATLSLADREELDGQSTALLALAQQYSVDSPASLRAAADELNSVQKLMAGIIKRRRQITDPIDEAKRQVMDLFRPFIERCETSKDLLQSGIRDYEQQLVAERRAAEQAAREEAARTRAELREQARAAAADGEILLADELQEQAALVPTLPVDVPDGRVAGINLRHEWRAVVTDRKALLRAVADGLVPDNVVTIDQRALDRAAAAHESNLHWPGVDVTQQVNVSPRGR